MVDKAVGYKGNNFLKKSGTSINWTPEMLSEYIKCKDDIVYFTNTYIKIIHVDRGMINFIPFDFQEQIIETVHKNRFTILNCSRQSGKTTAISANILHYVIFNSEKTVALLANKGDTAREILGRIQLAYENLPTWLQQGVLKFNEGSLELENNSRIIATSTSSSAIRGYAISFLYIDECAFIEGWTEFYKSVYPTISSGQQTKVVLVSTPNGLNFYYKLWSDAVKGISDYIPIKVTWRDVPGRDEEWRRQTIANTSEEAFTQEHEAEFIGSAGTLIDGWRLKELVEETPIKTSAHLKQYKEAEEKHVYVLVADVSRGKGIDNSAYIVVDISQLPYTVVATYYCDTIPPDEFSEYIFRASEYYNKAFVLVENNDAGCQTIQVLNDTYECENLMGMMTDGQSRRVASVNGGQGFEFGVRTSKTVKAVGASRMKVLIENYSLMFGDKWIIDEINKFIRVGKSYEAQKEAHDDIVMCMLLFSWLTTQSIFEDMATMDARFIMQEQFGDRFQEEMLPFGFILDGIDTYGDDSGIEFMGIELADYEGTEFFDDMASRKKLYEEDSGFFT